MRHGFNRFAAISPGDERRKVNARCRGHFLPRDIRFEFGRFQRPGVDHEHLMPAPADLRGDKAVLFAFGVHSAENCDGCHSAVL